MYNSAWYYSLNQPYLTPPAWIFPPAWTFLYLTIIISLFLYGFTPTLKNKAWGYVLFFTQLVLNLCWTPAFFILQNIKLAAIIIILLDILVFLTILEFYKISKKAAFFLIPYFLWILFATYLNIGYLILN